jgi:hypothetical protein
MRWVTFGFRIQISHTPNFSLAVAGTFGSLICELERKVVKGK